MKIKICGLKYMYNIREVAECSPDYMGFIFYKGSKRYAGVELNPEDLNYIDKNIKKAGVFVNANIEEILNIVSRYNLDYVQLHGDESPEFCNQLSKHVKIIKAFGVDEQFNFSQLKNYKTYSTYFLFDTKSGNHGGSGIQFDWKILSRYDNEVPFFLSGGIDLDQIEKIREMSELNIHAIDVNSKFEIEPGLKDINKIKLLKDAIRR